MKKNVAKYTLLAVLTMALSIWMSMCAFATSEPSFWTTTVQRLGAVKKANTVELWLRSLGSKAEITAITSSNKKVLRDFKASHSVTGWTIKALSEKKGTSKITIKYKLNGKNKQFSKKITVMEYPSTGAVKSVKLDGKELTKDRRLDVCSSYFESGSKKIKVELLPGWTIVKKKSVVKNMLTEKTKKFSNGMILKKDAYGAPLEITLMLQNKKTKKTALYCITV